MIFGYRGLHITSCFDSSVSGNLWIWLQYTEGIVTQSLYAKNLKVLIKIVWRYGTTFRLSLYLWCRYIKRPTAKVLQLVEKWKMRTLGIALYTLFVMSDILEKSLKRTRQSLERQYFLFIRGLCYEFLTIVT